MRLRASEQVHPNSTHPPDVSCLRTLGPPFPTPLSRPAEAAESERSSTKIIKVKLYTTSLGLNDTHVCGVGWGWFGVVVCVAG